eukprot:TRINITY_DN12741_c0_g1_i5.p1 TRINITY_DN12741_c0_g1~~TRINITY_DN12741_c0_g1_i5.p1  ORF type:complete len:463 (-),score=75.49 TRINITY_DN12741_c0_g1_i5:346-1734(-)
MAEEATIFEKGAKYFAEFIGTFLLVFTVGCAVISNSQWAVVGIASVLMVMIYGLGPISGANFNPAVTLSLALSNKMEWTTVAGYWAAQMFAGMCAGTVFSWMLDDSIKVQPGEGFDLATALGAELIFTCMLCFVVLNVAVASASQPNQYFGLAIGSVIVSGGYAVGGISGACLNPAVTLGLVSSSLGDGALHGLCWMTAQMVGASFATVLFRLVRPDEFGGDGGLLASKVISEFFGTFMLALTVGLGVVAKSEATPLAAAACLMSMIYSLGNISGAHLNPAVSLGILMRGGNKIELTEWGCYTAAQVMGGFLAGDLAGLFYRKSAHTHTIMLGPGEYGLKPAIVAELFFTFVLVFVVLVVATVRDANTSQAFGLAIAACITAGGFAAGSISGGVLNPAVALGLMSDNFLMEGELPWANFMYWTCAELLGAVVAAAVFFLTWRSEYKTEQYAAMPVDAADASA